MEKMILMFLCLGIKHVEDVAFNLFILSNYSHPLYATTSMKGECFYLHVFLTVYELVVSLNCNSIMKKLVDHKQIIF